MYILFFVFKIVFIYSLFFISCLGRKQNKRKKTLFTRYHVWIFFFYQTIRGYRDLDLGRYRGLYATVFGRVHVESR